MKLINFRPLLFFAVSVCLGILSAYLFKFVGIVWSVLAGVATMVALIFLCVCFSKEGKVKRNVVFAVIAVAVFTLSFFNFKIVVDDYGKNRAGGLTYKVSARITEMQSFDGYVAILLTDLEMKGAYEFKSDYKMSAYIYDESCLFDVGDKVEFTARVQDLSHKYDGRFMANYLSDGIKYYVALNENTLTVVGNQKTVFEDVNVKIRNTLESCSDDDFFATTYAMLCGNSDYMNEEILRNFRAVGVAHIFAVSGLHIGFLAVVLRFVLTKFKVNRYVKFVLTVAMLVFYSGVCGFSSSSVRATIMCATNLLSESFGRKYDPLSSISLSLIIVLFINPVELFAVGFQLSFAVVYGITLLGSPLTRAFKFMPKKIAASLGTVLSAQLFSLPICLISFKEFSAVSVIANLIFVPIVGILFVLTFAGMALTLIFGAGHVFLFLPKLAINIVNTLFGLGDYSIFMIGGIAIGAFAIPYYAALIFSSNLFNIKLTAKRVLVICLCCFTICGCAVYNTSSGSVGLYIYGSDVVSASLFKLHKETVLIINSDNQATGIDRLKRTLNRAGVDVVNRLIIPENADESDIQIITGALLYLCKVDNVYYTASIDDIAVDVLVKSFPDIDFYRIEKEGNLTFDGLSIKTVFDGYALTCEYGGFRVALFSKLGAMAEKLYGFDMGETDLIVANDCADVIDYVFNPKKMMTFCSYGLYDNGETEGSCLIKIG